MTNQERRKRISDINESLSPLNNDKLVLSLRYNFLVNRNRQEPNTQDSDEIQKIEQQLNDINNKIYPLFTELRGLQIKYLVEYDGEGNPNKKLFYLSTDVNIDTYEEAPDYNNQDVWAILNELKDYIYYQEYSQFTIQHIKRL